MNFCLRIEVLPLGHRSCEYTKVILIYCETIDQPIHIEVVFGNTLMTDVVRAMGSVWPALTCLSWYSWKQGTMHKLV
jgi:hypothetical protein